MIRCNALKSTKGRRLKDGTAPIAEWYSVAFPGLKTEIRACGPKPCSSQYENTVRAKACQVLSKSFKSGLDFCGSVPIGTLGVDGVLADVPEEHLVARNSGATEYCTEESASDSNKWFTSNHFVRSGGFPDDSQS